MSTDERKPVLGNDNIEKFCEGIELPGNEPARTAPGQAFIDRFGLQEGSEYFARGLSMDEAAGEHLKKLEKENSELRAKLEAAGLA